MHATCVQNTNGEDNRMHQIRIHTTVLGSWENLINSQIKSNFEENRFGWVGYNINKGVNEYASIYEMILMMKIKFV